MSPLGPILLSLYVATLATLVVSLAGLGLARLFTRRRVTFAKFWESLILLPMVLPPTITGYILLSLLGAKGPIGSVLAGAGIRIVFSRAAAVIAAATVSLPLMYQHCKIALQGTDPRLADAARTLGMTESRIFRKITLPLAAPGVLGGIALSFARALGEFGATLMLAGNIPGRTQTIPLALFSAVESGRTAEANIYLLVTVIICFAVIAISGLAQRGRPGSRGESPTARSGR
ncbi:MAG: molybdate ABC transporter permease subunit [Rectinemataceae bacterium]